MKVQKHQVTKTKRTQPMRLNGVVFSLFVGDFVKLHSELADLTQLYLVGVGVDLVFPGHKNKKNNKNPNLTSARGKNPTCLFLFEYLIGV